MTHECNDSSPAAVAWLETLGYRVTFRVQGWTEGLVSCPGERWTGRGVNEREVIEDVLAQMLPSRAAMAALPDALRPVLLIDVAPAPVIEGVPPIDVPPPAGDAPAEAVPAPVDDRNGETVFDEGPADDQEAGDNSASPENAEPPPADEPARAPVDHDESAPPAPVPKPRVVMIVDEAVAALEPLMDRIEEERAELGLATPERQRLVILTWICHARAIEDAADGALPVVNRVAAIAKNLTALCKVYWPGAVFALQLNASPGKACRDLDLGPDVATPETWAEAADLAERALLMHEERATAAGRDEYGWADGFALKPAPLDPATDLAELRARVEKATGPVDAPPPKTPSSAIRSPGPKDRAQFVLWGRMVRWLRGAVVDFDAWSMVAGRLRWIAARLESKDDQLAKILDPTFRPPSTWAAALGRDRVEQRRKRDRLALYRRMEGLDPTDVDGAAAWLRDALDLLDKDAIARAMRRFQAMVLGIRPEEFTDRRAHRKRLRLVQAALGSGDHGEGAIMAADPEAATNGADETAVSDEAPSIDPGEALFARVRPHTEGRSVAFISNRSDPELAAMLQEALGFREIDWCEGTPRRVQAFEDRIAQRAFDFVLAATGFQSHCVDGALYAACKKVGVPYVRVNKGRPVACAAAIARRLALAP